MKFIISPSKTQKPESSEYLLSKELLYPKQHKKVLSIIRKLSIADIKEKMKLSDDLTQSVYYNIKNYNSNQAHHAFTSFEGFVFKGLERTVYKQDEYDFIQKNIRILDAFYGVLEPGTLIKPYRLDFITKIPINLYNHWDITEYFKDDILINLASAEFSKMVQKEMINISFLQFKNDKYINQATYSKQARGILLNYIIQNKIESIDKIKEFDLDNYRYNTELSDANNIVFTR